uniref:Alpha-1,3-mannosyl-glycoprotein 4-beta-N-acetylglucosaminyltransferase B n=1 Tax=Spermophilus dauricus TaxID=99837 RepID=A0A8C9Q7B8_SPEDA
VSRVAGIQDVHRWVFSCIKVYSRPPPGNYAYALTGDVVDVYQREFLALRDRLHAAEQESLKRSKELNLVLDEIKRAVSERQALRDGEGNRTWGRLTEDPRLKPWNVSHRHVLHLPTVFHHLPHLLAKESSLQPAVRVGQGRTGGRSVVA